MSTPYAAVDTFSIEPRDDDERAELAHMERIDERELLKAELAEAQRALADMTAKRDEWRQRAMDTDREYDAISERSSTELRQLRADVADLRDERNAARNAFNESVRHAEQTDRINRALHAENRALLERRDTLTAEMTRLEAAMREARAAARNVMAAPPGGDPDLRAMYANTLVGMLLEPEPVALPGQRKGAA